MPRIVYRGTGFERVASQSWLEQQFEDLVFERSGQIFPRWRAVRFKPDVAIPGTEMKRRPDLALIDNHYRCWWVVEVELQHHSLHGHVLPQISVFAGGRYDVSHANWIADRNPSLDRGRLTDLMLGEAPEVLVVVDAPGTGWEPYLGDVGAKLSVVEPFRDANGEFLLRVNGVQPEPPGEILTRCVRRKGVARMWAVVSPAALPPADAGGVLTVDYNGVPSRWRRLQLADAVMLLAERGDPLPDLSEVALILREDESLEFVAASRGQRRKG